MTANSERSVSDRETEEAPGTPEVLETTGPPEAAETPKATGPAEAAGSAEVTGPAEAAGATGTTTADEAPESAAVPASADDSDPETTPWNGPAMWVVPALVAVLGAVAVWGGFTIEAPPNATKPGPGAFPGAIGALLLLVAVCMTVVNLHTLRSGAHTGRGTLAWFEGRPVLVVLAGLVVHVAVLEFLGWLLAGALLFWMVAYAFGSRTHLRDAVVALSMSAAVQVGFSLGLGLSLPGGFLELVL